MRLALLLLLGLAGCVAGPNTAQSVAVNVAPGFWFGLWHGIIMPVTFVLTLLDPGTMHFYEVANNGGWYNLGFVFGTLVGWNVFRAIRRL